MKNQKVMHLIFVLSTMLALTLSLFGSGTAEGASKPSKKVLTVAIIDDPDDVDPRSSYDSAGLEVLYTQNRRVTFRIT
jgi:ABC-type oligopeptide transport system substrate-binding subunit